MGNNQAGPQPNSSRSNNLVEYPEYYQNGAYFGDQISSQSGDELASGRDDVRRHGFEDDQPHVIYDPVLDYLEEFRMLHIKQNLPNDMKHCCQGNTYKLYDENGKIVMRARETTFCNTCVGRWFCGPSRGFTMEFFNTEHTPLFTLTRPAMRCDCFCCFDCPLCQHAMTVSDMQGNRLGTVKQNFYICVPQYRVKTSNGLDLGRVEGPMCSCRLCCDMAFAIKTPMESGFGTNPLVNQLESERVFTPEPGQPITEPPTYWNSVSPDTNQFLAEFYHKASVSSRKVGPIMESDFKTSSTPPPSHLDVELEDEARIGRRRYIQTGHILKKWRQSREKANMDHEFLELYFPEGLDPVGKALYIGALFLVDFMYFEMS